MTGGVSDGGSRFKYVGSDLKNTLFYVIFHLFCTPFEMEFSTKHIYADLFVYISIFVAEMPELQDNKYVNVFASHVAAPGAEKKEQN